MTGVSVPVWPHGVMAWLVHVYETLGAVRCTGNQTFQLALAEDAQCDLWHDHAEAFG